MVILIYVFGLIDMDYVTSSYRDLSSESVCRCMGVHSVGQCFRCSESGLF